MAVLSFQLRCFFRRSSFFALLSLPLNFGDGFIFFYNYCRLGKKGTAIQLILLTLKPDNGSSHIMLLRPLSNLSLMRFHLKSHSFPCAVQLQTNDFSGSKREHSHCSEYSPRSGSRMGSHIHTRRHTLLNQSACLLAYASKSIIIPQSKKSICTL